MQKDQIEMLYKNFLPDILSTRPKTRSADIKDASDIKTISNISYS